MRAWSGLRFKTLVTVMVIVGLAGVGVSTSGAVTKTPTLTVTPNTGLADTQTVTLNGTGFGANAALLTIECPTGTTDLNTCDPSTLVPGFTDGSGGLVLDRPVRRLIAGPSSTVDCATAACEIAVSDGTTVTAHASIAFDPKIPPVLPKVKVAPATGLRDHQLVSVSGSGFDAFTFVDLQECLASDPTACAFETDHALVTSQTGTFLARTFAVEREFVTFDVNGNPQSVDCAKSATPCVIAASNGFGGGGVPSTAALQFNPALPLVTAKITARPTTGLGDLQDVTVTGSGFLPGSTVQVQQCAGGGINGVCGNLPTAVTAGFTGVFTTTFSVRRLLPVFTFLGLRVVDCATKAANCAILASDGGARDTSAVPLAFAPTKRAVTSTLLAFPRTGLHDNTRVLVGFVGFSAYQPVTMIECTAQAIAQQDTSLCDPNTQITTITPALGVVPNVTFFAKRVIQTGDGLVDCKAKAGSCILLATSTSNFSGGIITVPSSARAAASNHPSVRAAASLPQNLNRQTLKAAAAAPIPGIASTPLSFGP